MLIAKFEYDLCEDDFVLGSEKKYTNFDLYAVSGGSIQNIFVPIMCSFFKLIYCSFFKDKTFVVKDWHKSTGEIYITDPFIATFSL